MTKLEWIASRFSPSVIAKAISIPASTVKKVLASKNRKTKTYHKIENFYSRVVRSEVRKYEYEGKKKFSSKEADRIRSFSPDRFDKLESMLRNEFSASESIRTSKMPAQEFSNYLTLRTNGVSIADAEINYDQAPKKILKIAKSYLDVAKILAKGNRVKLEHILKGIRYSDRTVDDWDQYIEARKQQKWKPLRLIGPALYEDEDGRRYNI
jgi:hypothetical protein